MTTKKTTTKAPAKKERKLHGRNDAAGTNSDAKAKKPGKNVAVPLTETQEATAALAAGEKKLVPIANEVNVRLEKADQAFEKGNDHRLAAALKLEEARVIADEAGVKFKDWCEANVKKSYHTIRKLLLVAQSDNPKLAIADLRERNKDANKKLRDAKKSGSRDPKKKTATPAQQAIEGLSRAKDEDALKIVVDKAQKLGMKVLPRKEAEKLEKIAQTPVKPDAKSVGFEGLKEGFTALRASEKMQFVRWAAGEIGADVKTPNFGEGAPDVEDLQDLGPFKR